MLNTGIVTDIMPAQPGWFAVHSTARMRVEVLIMLFGGAWVETHSGISAPPTGAHFSLFYKFPDYIIYVGRPVLPFSANRTHEEEYSCPCWKSYMTVTNIILASQSYCIVILYRYVCVLTGFSQLLDSHAFSINN